jgi:predicted Zn-dependent protease
MILKTYSYRQAACFVFANLLLACTMPLRAQSSFSEISAKAAAAKEANQLGEAVSLYEKGLQLTPTWTEGWWSLGTIHYDRNEYREAASAFNHLASLDSKSGSARIMLGLCEFELGDDQTALKNIQEGERIGVLDNQQLRNVALFHEGELLRRAGKFEGAQQAFDSLCAGGVSSPELSAAFGMTVLRTNEREAPTRIPDVTVVNRVGDAECVASQKKFDAARESYVAIEKEFPDFPNLHYAFGRFLLAAHDPNGGIAELEEEIKRQPKHAFARLQIAAAKYKTDSAGGLPYARAAIELDPSLPFGHYLYGLLLLDTDDYKNAIPELERAEKNMREVPGIYSALAAAYSRDGRTQDAAKARAELRKLQGNATKDGVPQP